MKWLSSLCLVIVPAIGIDAAATPDAQNLVVQTFQGTQPQYETKKPFKLSGVICPYRNFVALGDSYAAGIHAIPDKTLPLCSLNSKTLSATGDRDLAGVYCTTEQCGRNNGAYSWGFNQIYRPDNYTFLGCTAATTGDVLTIQIPRMPKDADLVTIHIGGNDDDAFLNVVMHCVYVFNQTQCTTAMSNATQAVTKIGTRVDMVFKQLRASAPSARVVVFGYVEFWPDFDSPARCQSDALKAPSADEKVTMNKVVRGMNAELKKAAEARGFKFMDPNMHFEGHRLCDTGFSYIQWDLMEEKPFNRGVFHPTLSGQAIFMRLLEAVTGCQAPLPQS